MPTVDEAGVEVRRAWRTALRERAYQVKGSSAVRDCGELLQGMHLHFGRATRDTWVWAVLIRMKRPHDSVKSWNRRQVDVGISTEVLARTCDDLPSALSTEPMPFDQRYEILGRAYDHYINPFLERLQTLEDVRNLLKDRLACGKAGVMDFRVAWDFLEHHGYL